MRELCLDLLCRYEGKEFVVRVNKPDGITWTVVVDDAGTPISGLVPEDVVIKAAEFIAKGKSQ